jgi:hypothetical protein
MDHQKIFYFFHELSEAKMDHQKNNSFFFFHSIIEIQGNVDSPHDETLNRTSLPLAIPLHPISIF